MKKFLVFVLIVVVIAVILASCTSIKSSLTDLLVSWGLINQNDQPQSYKILKPDYVQPKTVKDLIKRGTKNILLIGLDDTGILYDTLCIANIDQKDNIIKLIMIPRDTYIPYNDTYIQTMTDKNLVSKGIYKINIANYVGKKLEYPKGDFGDSSINFTHDVLSELLGVKFDDYVLVNFNGFKQMVDAVDGVDVTVDTDIRDFTGQLVIPAGVQHLDGEKALFYARTRHLYDENGNIIPTTGDAYRKVNQLSMMKEMAKQIFKIGSVTRIPEIVQSFNENVKYSFTPAEITSYGIIGIEISTDKYTIETHMITGDSADPLNDQASYVIIN